MSIISERISPEIIMAAAKAVWLNKEVSDCIGSAAIQILHDASRINLKSFSGKIPKCIVSGLFYLLGYQYNVGVTQKEIADILCTTEVSVRKSSICLAKRVSTILHRFYTKNLKRNC